MQKWLLAFVIGCLSFASMILLVAKGATINPARQVAMRELAKRGIDEHPLDQMERETDGNAVAKVRKTEFRFDNAEPFTEMKCEFPIRNNGTGALWLKHAFTSCTCIDAEIPKKAIEPGEEGVIEVTWNTRNAHPLFFQTVTVETNDPISKQVKLTVTGKVRAIAAASPRQIELPRVRPDSESAGRFLIYSEVWDAIEVNDVICDVPGIDWELAEAEIGPKSKAKSAKWIKVKFPAGAFSRRMFNHSLEVHLVGRGGDLKNLEENKQVVKLPVVGKVLRRLSIYGNGIDADGVINLGKSSGKALECNLNVKVRDPEKRLTLKKLEIKPEILKAEFKERKDSSELGIYDLKVWVPANSPDAYYRGRNAGTIRLEFDHPRIEPLELRVEFFVDRLKD